MGAHQILFGAKIPFRGLHRCVPQQQLNLLQFATRDPAELRACTTQIVGSDPWDPGRAGVALEQLPDDLLAHRRIVLGLS